MAGNRSIPRDNLRGPALASLRHQSVMAVLEPVGRLRCNMVARGAKGTMKALLAVCLLATMTGAAAANFSPRAPMTSPRTLENWLINLGPAGAMLESDYFRAPQSPFAGGPVVPCQLRRSSIAGEIRLSFSCR